MTTPVIIEAAINGATPKRRNPNVPRSDDEIVADALACFDAGAAIVHHHLSVAGLDGDAAADAYLRIWHPVLAERPDALLYPTFNFGADSGHDHSHLEPLAASGLARMGLCDPGSVNLGRWRDGVPGGSFVYANDLDTVADQLTTCARLGLGPAVAIYEPGFLRIVMAWYRAGRLPAGTMVKFYLCDDFPEHHDGQSQSAAAVNHTAVALHLEVPNADEAIARAAAAGAKITMPAMDMFWGDRYGKIIDPFNHEWSFSHRLQKS